ncbi:UNVERIFIED_CONTAM: hypothetical protein PYX00_004810 [Menopon gallinae]|uniref:Uncharacterized protein n=1 Tax=Menopon gallinae TaxID=328185 RepID=A0AAW2I6U3_9NEOP
MFSFASFVLAIATVTMAQVIPQPAVDGIPEGITDVVLTGENVPETITTANGIIVTNGTPDKRCWFFMPVPVNNNPNGQPGRFNAFYNMYRPYSPYQYMYGRRPVRRPSKNTNQKDEKLPVFEAPEQSNNDNYDDNYNYNNNDNYNNDNYNNDNFNYNNQNGYEYFNENMQQNGYPVVDANGQVYTQDGSGANYQNFNNYNA